MLKPNVSRLESTVRKKMDNGWNAFTREEVEALMILLKASRRTTRSLQHRVHMSHGDAIAWHFEDSVGLHEKRPAPVGATNLFEKPSRLDFEPGWRIPKGIKIPGYSTTQNGELIHHTRRKPVSPNDAIRLLHTSLSALDAAYRNWLNGTESTNLEHSDTAEIGGDHPGEGDLGVNHPQPDQQSSPDRADLSGDGEAPDAGLGDHPDC